MRRAAETWTTITDLVADTLDHSPAIKRSEVVAVLSAVADVGQRLVAGGHLSEYPIVLVAEHVHLSIFTVSGADAIGLDENLNAVPGAAQATDWMLHIPAPPPLTDVVTAAVAGTEKLTTDAAVAAKAASRADPLDMDALARMAAEGKL
ncbi:MAG: hypothetical protein M0004_00285 [Actinomycetota bacterium]|nr:hypothetical protein [Actinomycetota bacterium]